MKCQICSKVLVKKQKYTCSLECKSVWQTYLQNARKYPTHFVCTQCGVSFRNSGSRKLRRFCSHACYWRSSYITTKSRETQEVRLKAGTHNLYLGGVTPKEELERQRDRHSVAYRDWRIAVFVRDDYTCQACEQRGGKLHADHVKSFAHYPESRFDISNGRTLCIPCHKLTPNYGSRARALYDKERPRVELSVSPV